jgi:outer membrane lipoprotein SlyB
MAHVQTASAIARAGLFGLALALGGCVTHYGDYGRGDVGRPLRLEEGVIERVRSVTIDGGRTILGPVTGAAIGGIAGSQIGGGDEERTIMAIAGAVLGGMVGSAIEQSANRREGVAYTVRTRDGHLENIVQEGPQTFWPGQYVYIEYGVQARVVPR